MNLLEVATAIADRYQHGQVGQPSKIGDATVLQLFLSELEHGVHMEPAAELAGLSPNTVRSWLKKGEEGEEPHNAFLRAYKRARASAESRVTKNILKASEDPRFWAAGATYLERTHPDRWARRSEDSSSPKVIVQIGGNVTDVKLLTVSDAGNHNAAYQTQTLGECERSQALTAPYPGAIEAKD